MAADHTINVVIQRCGLPEILSVQSLTDAKRLHDYLKSQGCTVGELFQTPGEFSFFAYSLRHPIRDTISQHGGYRLWERPRDVE